MGNKISMSKFCLPDIIIMYDCLVQLISWPSTIFNPFPVLYSFCIGIFSYYWSGELLKLYACHEIPAFVSIITITPGISMPAEVSRTVLMNFQNKPGKTHSHPRRSKKFPTSIINPYLLTWHYYQQCLAGGHNHVCSEVTDYFSCSLFIH